MLSPNIETRDAVMDTITAGEFRLPYPRCGFMYQISSGNVALQYAALLANSSDIDNRYMLTVAEQHEDGSILCYSFIFHDGYEHWIKQIWQGRILQQSDIELAHDQPHDLHLHMF